LIARAHNGIIVIGTDDSDVDALLLIGIIQYNGLLQIVNEIEIDCFSNSEILYRVVVVVCSCLVSHVCTSTDKQLQLV